jgi:metal-dependent amidase/aminoacylase/carboxypeptidase family protein
MLSQQPVQKGKVLLLFQPAEENGMGAQAVLEDKRFQNNTIEYVFALHNLPGYHKHNIVVKEHEFTGNVKSIIVKLKGKTSHAAEPEQGYNPAIVIADILKYADDVTHNRPEENDFFLMTPVYVNMGDLAYGISAGYGEVHCTIRSWSTELMDHRCEALVNFIEQHCKQHRIIPEISWTQVFHANINHPDAVAIVRKAAVSCELTLVERDYPFKWGEDFGLFTQRYKGSMFGLGAGMDTPALHNPDYDFPDETIVTGVNMFNNIIRQIN